MVVSREPNALVEQFIVAMPKVELHIHLEGSVQPTTLLELARKNDIALPARDQREVTDYFQFRDFSHFLDVYMAVCECLRSPGDFARIVEELGEQAAAQNIRYLEVHFNPESHVRKRGVPFTAMLEGMNRGRMVARDRFGIELRWIADGIRDAEPGPISVMQTVDWISGLSPTDGVVALGLGGDELGHPPSDFVAAFAKARAAGLHTVAHAGETTGPETIWSSLHDLHVERIGHGVRAVEDPALLSHLAKTGIPLEICPTSNIRTRVVEGVADHQIRRLDDAGVRVTLSTDDPALFGCTLSDEYRILVRDFGYQVDDVKRISMNAVEASFLAPEEKQSMIAEFEQSWAVLLHDLGEGSAAHGPGAAASINSR